MNEDKVDQQTDPSWEAYYEWLQAREPRPVLIEAVARFATNSGGGFQQHAIDLGCGDGTETLALLEAGWSVLAIDREPAAITHVRSKVAVALQPQLETMVGSFENLHLSETDLVFAGYRLPFCRPEYFDDLWVKATACIRSGGRFAGQLFGIRDSWANNPEMTFHSAEHVSSLLANSFEVEVLEEIDEDGHAFSGPKHWHVFNIIARVLE